MKKQAKEEKNVSIYFDDFQQRYILKFETYGTVCSLPKDSQDIHILAENVVSYVNPHGQKCIKFSDHSYYRYHPKAMEIGNDGKLYFKDWESFKLIRKEEVKGWIKLDKIR